MVLFVFQAHKVSSWSVTSFFKKSSISWNIRKAFFLENGRIFLILGLKSSISWDIRNFVMLELETGTD